MSYRIPHNQLYQLAQAELRKSSQYKSVDIPEFVIQNKIKELAKLSHWEIQAKLNDYFKAEQQVKDGWAIFGLDINPTKKSSQNNTQNSNSNSINLNEPEMRAFAIDLLSNNASGALQAVKNYHNNIGYISSDAVAQGLNIIGNTLWDSITGRNDFLPLVEQETNIENELNKLDELKNKTSTRADFNKGFKDLYGIEFNPTAFKKLQEANTELSKLNANEALETYFDYGIKEIQKESPQNAGFKINALLNPIFNNPLKTQDFINEIKNSCKTDEEFKARLIHTLTKAKFDATKAKNEILKNTSREDLENNYKKAYKEAMGDYHAQDIVEQYLQTQQSQAMTAKQTLILAASMLVINGSAVKGIAEKASSTLGIKVGEQVVKAGLTAATAPLPAAETIISGLTSKNQNINWELAEEQFKTGLIFNSFASYVSAPAGDTLVKLLKANPKFTSAIMQKVFSSVGFATEVSLDAIFEFSISEGEMGQLFKENAQGELLGRFMHMFLGGQAHHVTKNIMADIKLKQEVDNNGKTSYSLVQNGKTLYQTNNPENIIAGVASIVGDVQRINVQEVINGKVKGTNKEKGVQFPETPHMDKARAHENGDQRLNRVYNKYKFQKEISKCLDAIIDNIDPNFKPDKTRPHNNPYENVMLPDGTILAENQLKWPDSGEVTIYARDINGKEYFLTATDYNNKKKAALILDYMTQLPKVPREQADAIQAEIKAGKTVEEAIKTVENQIKLKNEEVKRQTFEKIKRENTQKPKDYLVKNVELSELKDITLTEAEKSNAIASGKRLDTALIDKKRAAINEANATLEVQKNVEAHLNHLISRVMGEKTLATESVDVPFYTAIELSDGTKIMRETVLRSSDAYVNGRELRLDNEPYEIISVVTPDGKKEFYPTIRPFAEVAGRNLLEVMGKAIAAEQKHSPKSPAGMDSAEDLAIRRAIDENPAEKVANKVKEQWVQADLETKVKEEKVDLFNLDQNAGLKQGEIDVNGDVTSLIFTGKLKEKLTQRYVEMGKVFEEIISKNKDEIKALAKENGNNKQAYAEGVVKILSREFGLEGFEPKIEFTDTDGATGLANWYDGKIQIDKYTNNVQKLTSIISHEFTHMLQFRDVLAQYGEPGVREMIMNDKSIPADKKDFLINKALNNDFTRKLLDSYDLQKAEKNSLNDYIRRVYKDEFTNTITDGEKYPDQVTEREAYHLGSGKIGKNVTDLADVELEKSDWEVKEGDIQEINGQKFRINSDGTITRLTAPQGPAGYAITTEADYRTATQKLCYDDIGTYHHDAKELRDAIDNSKMYEENWDPYTDKLDDFKTIINACKIDGRYDPYLLTSAKEMVKLAGQKEDKYLRQSSAFMIEQILNSIKKLPDEAQIEAVDATKELLTSEKVRNGVIDDIILSCIDNGKEFNKDAFRKIYDYHKEVEATSYEVPYSYSLRVAETAKTSCSYVKDANGNWKKVFDDAVFEVAKLYASSANFVHIDLSFCRNRDTEEFHFSQLPDFVKEKMVKTLPEKIEKAFDSWEKHDINKTLEICKTDGEYDAENLFALYYMKNVLKINTHDINKYITQLKNQNGKVDISMLNLIKRAGNSINKNNDAHRILELGANLYNKNGKVQNQEVETMLDSYAINFIKYIKDDIITDGRINIEKFKEIDTKLKDIHSKLQQLGFRKDSNDEVFRIFNKGKADPKAIDEIYSLLEKLPNEYIPNAFKNFRDFIFTYKSDGKDGVDIDKLRYYAEMPTDLLKVAYHNYSIDNYLQGEPLVVDYYIEHLKSNEIETLAKHGIKIDYLKESNANKNNRTIKTTPEQQQRFENTLNLLEETLAKANISEGIELTYSKSQLDKDINDIVKDLPERTKTELLNLYGLSISDGIIHGVACMPKTEAPDNLKSKANAIKQHLKTYLNNTVKTDNPDLKAIYESLTKDFPEFSMLVGKIGADGQRIDTTVLNQLKAMTTSESYKSLSAEDKKLAKLAVMFNAFKDIDAKPNTIEKHFSIDNDGLMFDKVATRAKNAEFTNFILKRFDLTDTEKYRLTELVSHIGWSEAYKADKISPMEIAVNTRFGDIELAKTIEDTINPKNDIDLKPIKEARTKLFQNIQILNSSTYEDLKPYFKKGTLCGVECEILDLRTTKLPEDSTLLMHVTERGLVELHNLLNNGNDKVFLSNSLVQANNAKTFAGRSKGIVSEFDNVNIAQAYGFNIDSGFGKDYKTFIEDLSSPRYKFIADEVKESLKLSDSEYGLLMEKISEFDSFKDVPDCTINGRKLTKDEIKQAHNNAYQKLMQSKSEQNEITILNQRPFAYTYKASASWHGEDGGIAHAMTQTGLKRVIILP